MEAAHGIYVPYVHNQESARKILRTRHKKEMVVLENSPYITRLCWKRLQIRRPKERNLDLHATCMVNRCQEKDAGIIFRLNYPIHQYSTHWDEI